MTFAQPSSIDLQQIIDDPEAWEFFRDGIDVHWLYRNENDSPSAALLKYAPGASVPRHRHSGFEHIYVLQGSQVDEYGEHHVGNLAINPPGTAHSIESPEGCIVYAVWEKPVVFEPEPTS